MMSRFSRISVSYLLFITLLLSTDLFGNNVMQIEKSWHFAHHLYEKGMYIEAEEEAYKQLSKKKTMKFIDRHYISLLLLQARAYQKLYRFKDARRIISRTDGYIKILTRKALRIDATLLLCDYFLEEKNVLGADHLFREYIPDSLLKEQITSREDADILLMKGRILTEFGYARDAIELLKKSQDYFAAPSINAEQRYFVNEQYNEEAYLEKYAEASYSLAHAQLIYGTTKEVELTTKTLISWCKSHLPKDNIYRHKPWQLLTLLYEKTYRHEEALQAYISMYIANPHNDNESYKQGALLASVIKHSDVGKNLEAKDYMRRLEMKASRNAGSIDPAQLAYDLAYCYQLFLHKEYATSLSHIVKLEKSFGFLPEEHPYRALIVKLKKEIYFYSGNISGYLGVLERVVKSKSKTLGSECPAYRHYVLELALAECQYLKLISKPEKTSRDNYSALEKQISPYSPDNAHYLEGFSKLYSRLGKYDSALVALKKAEKAGLESYGDQSVSHAFILAKLGEVSLMASDYSGVSVNTELASKIASSKRFMNSALVALQLQLARNNRLAGAYKESEFHTAALKRLLSNGVQTPFILQQEVIGEQARLFYERGNFYRAGKKCNEAKIETNIKKETFSPWLLQVYDTKAQVNIASGNYALAEAAINSSFQISDDNSFERSLALMTQSDYLLSISDYPSALDAALKADDIRMTKLGAAHFYRYATMARIALIKSRLTNPNRTEIENLYLGALSIINACLGTHNPFYYKTEQDLAEFYLQEGKFDLALPLLIKELEYWNNIQGETSNNSAYIKGLIGDIYYAKSKYDDAEDQYTSASRIYLSLFNNKHPGYLKIQSKLARVYFMKNDTRKTVSMMNDIVTEVMDYSKKYFTSLSFRQRNRFWNSFKEDFEFYTYLMLEKNEKDDAKRISDLYNTIVSTKGILLNSDIKLRKKILEGKDTVLTNLFNNWLSQKELLTYALSLNQQEQKEQDISTKAVEQEIEKIEKQMGDRSNVFKQSDSKNQMMIETVTASLDPNEYAIEMVRYRKFDKVFTDSIHYAAIIIEKNAAPQYVILTNGSFLEKRLFNYYRNSMMFTSDDDLSFANYWKPVKEKIPDGSKIFFSGEGVFNQINIETLKKPSGDYVIDKDQMVYITNTRDIVPTGEKETKLFRRTGAFTLFGNPEFYLHPAKHHSLSSLAGAEKEVNMVEEIAHTRKINATKMTGNSVVETFVKKIANPKLFHIATHGYFKEAQVSSKNEDENFLLNSGLMLAGSGDIIDGNEGIFINKMDGILTANEVLDLNFDQTDLVVLSACETGRGEVQNGEGVYGLQRAFLIAGSKAIILSLFKVDDEVTQLLMKEFYQRWFANGNARVSFNEAKKKIKEIYPNPVNWGAFILVEKNPKTSAKEETVLVKRR